MAHLYKTSTGQMFHAGTICLVPVGLPARGKTFMSAKLGRYLRWLGVKTKVFNVGQYRRKMFGKTLDHQFFDIADSEAMAKRNAAGDAAYSDMVAFFQEGGQVAIFDHTLTIMHDKRQDLIDKLTPYNVHVIFIETICDNPDIIESNIREVKLNLPDYQNWDKDKAVADFLNRIQHHVPHYDAISDPSLSYIQVINMSMDSALGDHIVANNIRGYLQTRLVYFLMNVHIAPRTVYLVRNADPASDDMFKDDNSLSTTGHDFAQRLEQFVSKLRTGKSPTYPKIFTSTRRRSYQTAQYFPAHCVTQKTELVQLNPGDVEAMSDSLIESEFPDEFAMHKLDPFNHRFPRAESYHDLGLRLESLILEIEGEKGDVMIVAHLTTLRCLYAYLKDLEGKEIPFLEIPANCLLELTPSAMGTMETRHFIDQAA